MGRKSRTCWRPWRLARSGDHSSFARRRYAIHITSFWPLVHTYAPHSHLSLYHYSLVLHFALPTYHPHHYTRLPRYAAHTHYDVNGRFKWARVRLGWKSRPRRRLRDKRCCSCLPSRAPQHPLFGLVQTWFWANKKTLRTLWCRVFVPVRLYLRISMLVIGTLAPSQFPSLSHLPPTPPLPTTTTLLSLPPYLHTCCYGSVPCGARLLSLVVPPDGRSARLRTNTLTSCGARRSAFTRTPLAVSRGHHAFPLPQRTLRRG